jgi:hypothetical protein
MLGGLAAGNLFFMERMAGGVALLALAAVFLYFAMSDLTHKKADDYDELMDALLETEHRMAALTLMLAESSVDGFKRIGRTMPCTLSELNKFEDDFLPLFDTLRVSKKDRDRILQEIDKLRTRSRQGEGRRALIGGR